MEISIPKQLAYSDLKALMLDNYEMSITGNHRLYSFNWKAAHWANLPQIVAILNWSSKLTHLRKNVLWEFPQPLGPIAGIEDLQGWSEVSLSADIFIRINKRLDELKRRAASGNLYPGVLRDSFERIKALAAPQGKLPSAVRRWLDAEATQLGCLNLLAYLNRYEIFDRAEEVGIRMSPDPRTLPQTIMARTLRTGALELRKIQSTTEASSVVDELCDPQELDRVLGSYAALDVVRRGALAQILVTELGQNVGEHANASAAWLCTRLVTNEQARAMSDPMLRSFRDRGEGFLEIIVSDNGDGLTHRLEQVISKDQRASVRIRYKRNSVGRHDSSQLIDYAFDRLSSTKRDIAELIHLEKQPGSRRVVASGLYWVWSVVRSHQGVLAINTANLQAWYDFTTPIGREDYQSVEPRKIESDSSSAPSCGTMIRVCLPLKDNLPALSTLTESLPAFKTEKNVSSRRNHIRIVWVGDLARQVPLGTFRDKNATLAESQTLLPGIESSHEAKVLHELQLNHFPLVDGDILVLDLCGMRRKWVTHSVAAICHFFLEMNYTSTVGRSAVVLWNVPASAKELFEKGIEIAGEPYRHLEDFRRAALMVFDDGTTRLFCGWAKAERVLNLLRYEGELDLDNIRDVELSEAEMTRLKVFITENSHLFDWIGRNGLRLRPWSFTLRGEAWRQGMKWFNSILNKPVVDRGVLLSLKHGYFRLPSNGLYVKTFYQFRGLLSNHQDCARIAWHLAQVIKSIRRKEQVAGGDSGTVWLVSVSRSTIFLLQHLFDNYFKNNGSSVKLIAASSIAELEVCGREVPKGSVGIFITDVISSGSLCEQVAKGLPSIRWLGSIALLDTREASLRQRPWPKPIELEPSLSLFMTKSTATGAVYTLASRSVKKLDPAKAKIGIKEPVTAIDEINVCAVVNPENAEVDGKFWLYLERKPNALHVGHIPGDYHHYIYYVDIDELLDSVNPVDGKTLLSFMVNCIVEDLSPSRCDPDEIVIMHPPASTSSGERIGKRVQEATGALYRHTLYKDNFAGHWRFSPFVQHGLPLEGCTLVLIDDGTNTAETLMGLLDAATFGKPATVLAYVGLTRMPPHKNHLFLTIKSMKNVTGDVNIRFTLDLSIPVYSPKDCSICKLRSDLSRVAEYSPLLRKYAEELKKMLAEIVPAKTEAKRVNNFLWQYATPLGVAKLREAIERLDYDVSSSEYVSNALRMAAAKEGKESKAALLDLAFIICSEPQLGGATVLVPYLRRLIAAAAVNIQKADQESLLTLVGFAFHMLFWLVQKGIVEDIEAVIGSLWRALFKRHRVSIHELCLIITLALSEALTDRDTDNAPSRTQLCRKWLEGLRERIDQETTRDPSSILSLAYLPIREALAVLHGLRPSYSPLPMVKAFVDLYDLADQTASQFWWHASDNVKGCVDTIVEALSVAETSAQSLIYGPIHQLVHAFDGLYELQQRLCEIEEASLQKWHEKSGAEIYWNTPELSNAIANCVQAFTAAAQTIEERPAEGSLRAETSILSQSLTRSWKELYRLLVSAFDAIFPQVLDVVGERWDKFQRVTRLPHSADGGVLIEPKTTSIRQARVFLPRTLLSRFLTVAMLNLRTAAFSSWTQERIELDATAFIEISQCSNEAANPMICLRVVDNGNPGQLDQDVPSGRHGKGLDDVSLMAENFRAKLIKPFVRDAYTVVELRMMYRTVRSSSHDNIES